MALSDWFYQRDGNVVGPISKRQIDYLKSVGRITDGQLIREGNRGDWIPVRISRQRAQVAKLAKPPTVNEESSAICVEETPRIALEERRRVPPAVPTQESADRRIQRQVVIAILLLLLLLLLLWWFWPTTSQPSGSGSDASGDGLQSEGDGHGQESTDGDAASGAADQGLEVADDAAQATDPIAVNPSGATNAPNDATSEGATGSPSVDADSSTSSQSATSDSTMDSTATPAVSDNDDSDSQLATNGAALAGSGDSPFTITAPGEATFFGLNATGRTFVFVVDCSGSMAGAPLQRAKAELLTCVRALPSRVEVKVVFFSSVSRPDPKGYRKLDRRNVDGLEKWINTIAEGGGTEVILGMNDAFSGSKKPDAIFLLTDGQFDGNTPAKIQQLNPDQKTRINTIALISRSGESLLKKIANENRGDYRFVP